MMKIPNKNDDDLNYWQSISDVMAALLLIVLLIMMLFILYMTRVPSLELTEDIQGADDKPGDIVDDDYESIYDTIYWGRDWNLDDGRDGTDRRIVIAENADNEGQYTASGKGTYEFDNGDDFEGHSKCAVFTKVIDGETKAPIKEAGVTFTLNRDGTGVQKLYTYYPKKECYEVFATEENGTSFLPEKIALGYYHFSEISVPYGYDRSENIRFRIDESHDWNDAYVVTVELYPSKNTIRIQNTDLHTNEAIAGGTYDVIAATDIVTADGTQRYEEGEIVDTIKCNEEGYGESIELYLGHYKVVPSIAPDFYALYDKSTDVFLERKDAEPEPIISEQKHERTTFNLRVVDELYEDITLSNVRFELKQENGPLLKTTHTQENGLISLNELEKDQTYILTQMGSADGYIPIVEPIVFHVTGDGKIEGSAEETRTATNRKLRTTIVVKDALLGMEIANKSIALYSSEGKLLDHWTTTAVPTEFDGLEPGEYRLVYSGKDDAALNIEVENIKDVQRFTYIVWTLEDTMIIGVGTIIIISVIAAIIVLRRKRVHEVKNENA